MLKDIDIHIRISVEQPNIVLIIYNLQNLHAAWPKSWRIQVYKFMHYSKNDRPLQQQDAAGATIAKNVAHKKDMFIVVKVIMGPIKHLNNESR